MYNEDKTPEELAEERDRFYIYTSYEEQMDMLTYEQIGRAICALYHYFHTGEKLVQEKEVNMMLSFMTSKLDDDTKRYAQKVKKRREDARRAGLASAEARREKARLAELAEAEQYSTTVNDCQRFQPDRERDRDRDNERDNDRDKDNDGDREGERENYYYYSRSRSTGDDEETQSKFIPYGQEQHLTTRAEVEKFEALAGELMHTYRNKKATPYDCEKVFAYVHTLGVTDDGEHYGIYSDKKADLLRHVFAQAAIRSDLNWQYIDRIYLNYEKHRVTSVEEAMEYEGKWQRGEIA